jgi:hypothetical protein
MTPIKNVITLILILSTFCCWSQFKTYTEVGVMAGPVFFQSDYGERGNFENFYKNNGYNLGVYVYLTPEDCCCPSSSNSNYKQYFKLRFEFSFMKSELKHYGQYVAPERTSLFANQLRGMRGNVTAGNIGVQIEYYPWKTDDYKRGEPFSPYISFGTVLSYYNSKAYSLIAPLGTPAATPVKYVNAYRNDSGIVSSLTLGAGGRYKIGTYHALVLDTRVQAYFSDWVDGLNPNRKIYKENKFNDWSTAINLGYIYYFN